MIPWTVFSPLRKSSDDRGHGGTGEDGDERLAVDLPQLADGGEQHDEHEREHPRRGRERAHQAAEGER